MKGDFTRDTFRKEKHYSSVRMQQGRVQLDADWNEQADIDEHLRETSLGDLIGRCGAPRTGGGFKVGLTADEMDLTLSAGRLYVDGILCELGPPSATYTQQHAGLDPELAAELKPALPAQTGTYFVYADVWQRHLTALEDPPIRETALGGPDTATRTQAFWRIRLFQVGNNSHCLSAPQAWLDATSAPSGQLEARTHPGAPSQDPCIVPANAGYTLLENQLYRVEVHKGGSLGTATFKWSRENGSVVSEWLSVDNVPDAKKPKLTVRSAGRDKALGFVAGQWVELIDDVDEIENQPGRLAKLLDVQGNVLTLDLPTGPPLSLTDYPVNPKVRRWDSPAGEVGIAVPAENEGWLPLEGGIEVRFKAGTYRTGDYWLIPARAFIGESGGDIEWPRNGGNPVAQSPHGIVHRYCKLAVVDYDFNSKKFSNVRDCRLLFPAVTELLHLFHVGGDGQEALPGNELACLLQVGVTNGQWPVQGARVTFTVSGGGGTITVLAGGITGVEGIALCRWRLPPPPPPAGNPPCLVVTATLRDVAGNPVSIPVVFHARLSVASQIAYDSGDCIHLDEATTVQEALDILCANVDLSYVGGDGQHAGPGKRLPAPLEVRVANGQSPQPEAKVRFTIILDFDTGMLAPDEESAEARTLTVTTGADGLASCVWRLDQQGPPENQRVEAVLLGAGDQPIPGQVIHFNASFAEEGGSEPGIHIMDVSTVSNRPVANDAGVAVVDFAQGLRISCDQEVTDVFTTPATDRPLPAKPNFTVDLYLPYPLIPAERDFWASGIVGFKPLLLAGRVTVVVEASPEPPRTGNQIVWQPVTETQHWLEGHLFQFLVDQDQRPIVDAVLVRVRVDGNFIWGRSGEDRIYLDGDVFAGEKEDSIPLRLPSGDGRKGGAFEMWFWLLRPATADFFLRASVSAQVVTGNVRQVAGAAAGSGLSGAIVTLTGGRGEGMTVRAKEDGSFQFPPVQPGKYIVEVTVPGGSLRRNVTVGGGPLRPEPLPPLELLAPEEAAPPAAPPSDLRLADVPGIGRRTEAKLREKGVTDPVQLAEMTPEELVEMGIPAKQAKEIIKDAKRLLEERSEEPDDQ